MNRWLAEKMIDKNKDRETIIVDCNAQYGRCEVVNNLKAEIIELKVRKDKAMNEDKFQQLYLELERIIYPQLTDDFCGYNEETQAFDIVLAIKEILSYKDREIARLKIQLDEYKQLLYRG